jgi:alpha-L-arabinofuranosidase
LIADQWQNSMPSNRPVEIIDEHYYDTPEFFIANAHKYDGYDRKGPKVYVGEYAVTQNCGTGNLRGAVGEAAFMTGIERNSDVVTLASYAPLFANVHHKWWNPDMINFDTSRSYGTPSYYVQKMFSEHRGDVVLPTTIADTTPSKSGEPRPVSVGLSTWGTQAEFKDIRVSDGDKQLFAVDFANGLSGWSSTTGQWSVKNGTLQQNTTGDGPRIISKMLGNTDRYTLRLKARKIGGNEGFLVMFRVLGDDTWAWWNLGGWNNKKHAIEQSVAGVKNIVGDAVPDKIETGRWYDIRIATDGNKVRCYLDDKLIHDVALASWQPKVEPLFAVASRVNATGEVIVKVVNATPVAQDTQLRLQGLKNVRPEAMSVVLTSGSGTDENTLDQPTKVSPIVKTITNASSAFRHVFPANSVTVLRLRTQ